ncbi:MAG: alpha/beta fold hydrolase [Phycisphaeraceae bacterium]|nr:alpha/beta fold hydrolase [Phycisphaeraceae bacterium]
MTASHAFQTLIGPWYVPPPSEVGGRFVVVPATDEDGPVTDRTTSIAYLQWGDERASNRMPVVLLHGSPGQAFDFVRLGPLLARERRVIAIDLPGFGNSDAFVPSYSNRAHAHAVLEVLDALNIERAHLVGWSNGGGVALHAADIAPDRVASIALVAATGVQETEGTGSYFFERVKYAAGFVAVVVVPELVPHFGALADRGMRRAFIRSFWDTDQRLVEPVMERLTVPVLVLHGRDDFLVPAWGAVEHHERMNTSRLVLIDASHFLPFLQAEETATHLLSFLARHDAAGVPPLTYAADLAPDPRVGLVGRAAELLDAIRVLPWWAVGGTLLLLARLRPEPAAALAGLLVATFRLDFGLAAAALAAGLSLRASAVSLAAVRSGTISSADSDWARRFAGTTCRRPDEPPPPRTLWHTFTAVLVSCLQPWQRDEVSHALGARRAIGPASLLGLAAGSLFWATLVLIAATLAGQAVLEPLEDAIGLVGVALACIGTTLAVRTATHAVTWSGRRRMIAAIDRLPRHEYWPSFVFYLPLLPWIAWLSVRHRGPMTWTCCNPAIPIGGGIVGESKSEILRSLSASVPALLPSALIEPGSIDRRCEALRNAMLLPDGVGPYPLVLKPDVGQRGYGVRIVRSEDDARRYFEAMPRAVVAQTYHPGPRECGITWVRDPHAPPGRIGRIYAVTRKEFPVVVGDGRRTIEELVYRDRRFRRQAGVFLARFAGSRGLVPSHGERVRLAQSGNHAQGTLFRDGADLITPELEAHVDTIIAAYASPVGTPADSGIDYARLDIRYESDDLLRLGRGLGVVELNGTTGEPTNLYDPGRALLWAYSVLFGQWSRLYRLGEMRRRGGVRPVSPRVIAAAWLGFTRRRPDVGIAD